MRNRIITIARQNGSGGYDIGKLLSAKLGIPFYDKRLIADYAREHGMQFELLETMEEPVTSSFLYSLAMGAFSSPTLMTSFSDVSLSDQAFNLQSSVIKQLAGQSSCVIVGRCADDVLKSDHDLLTVFVHADMKFRSKRAIELYGLESEGIEQRLNKVDKQRANYYNYCTGKKWGAAVNYHLCIDSGMLGVEGSVALIEKYLEINKTQPRS